MFLNKTLIYSNIQCTFLISFEIMRDKERGAETGREGWGLWEWEAKGEKEEAESERTKCNLSAYSDNQCLKWELTENVDDCSLIGQGHSWHFQAKLQRRWQERMCRNYKLFSALPALMSQFTKPRFFFRHICIMFYLDSTVFIIMLVRCLLPTKGWADLHTEHECS